MIVSDSGFPSYNFTAMIPALNNKQTSTHMHPRGLLAMGYRSAVR